MIRRVSLALMDASNMRRSAERNGRAALHPLAEYYGDWERARAKMPVGGGSPFDVRLPDDEECPTLPLWIQASC
jgi:hypothetical protein